MHTLNHAVFYIVEFRINVTLIKFTNNIFILLRPTKHFISLKYQDKNVGLTNKKNCLQCLGLIL